MAWTIEDQSHAFLAAISSGREGSVGSALYDLVNHFSVDYLQHLTEHQDTIARELDLYGDTSDKRLRIVIDGALMMLSLIKEGKCRCEILTKGAPASPLNLEKSSHMINVDEIEFYYDVSVTGRYDCAYCGRRFTMCERPGFSEPEWRLLR
tara:strand:- start:115 stop:567 length:453 start_codon:yes stop_codon:yes gene_type:complete